MLAPTPILIPPTPKFFSTTECSPPILLNAIRDINFDEQVPIALATAVVMAAVSSLVASFIDVESPTGKIGPSATYSLILCDSGKGKSAAERVAFRVLKGEDRERRKLFNEENDRYPAALEEWAASRRALIKAKAKAAAAGKDVTEIQERLDRLIAPKKPRLRQILRSKMSLAAFRAAVKGVRESLALINDEGGAILTRDFIELVAPICDAWDGDEVVIDLAKGAGIVAESPRVTLALMVQIGIMQRFYAKYGPFLRDHGLIARLLVIEPGVPLVPRFFQQRKHESLGVSTLHARMRELLDMSKMNDGKPRVLKFDEYARVRWFNYANEVESYAQPWQYLCDAPDVASKIMENVTRVAAQFHAIAKDDDLITVESLERAYDYVWFHVHQFKRIFATPQDVIDAGVLERHLHRVYVTEGKHWVWQTDVLQCGPECLRNAKALHAAIYHLAAAQKIFLARMPKKDAPGEQGARVINLNVNYFAGLPRWVA